MIEIKWSCSEREKNGKDYNECNYDPWVEDEESPHFLDDDAGLKEKRKKKREWEDLFGKLLGSFEYNWMGFSFYIAI